MRVNGANGSPTQLPEQVRPGSVGDSGAPAGGAVGGAASTQRN
jgi:hypothetical protein